MLLVTFISNTSAYYIFHFAHDIDIESNQIFVLDKFHCSVGQKQTELVLHRHKNQ